MMKPDVLKGSLWGILVSAVICYTLVGCQLGFAPNTWEAQIASQQLAAERAEYDRVCGRVRP